MLTAVYEVATGALVREYAGGVDPQQLVAGHATRAFERPPYPRQWDAVALQYTMAPFTTIRHAAFEAATGRLLSESARPIDPLFVPAGVGLASFATLPLRPTWDAATRTYVAGAVPVRERLAKDEMARRFTLAERTALKVAKLSHANMTVRARLEILEEDILLADRFDITDPYLRTGLTYAVDALVTLGVVTPLNRDARLAALLTPIAVTE